MASSAAPISKLMSLIPHPNSPTSLWRCLYSSMASDPTPPHSNFTQTQENDARESPHLDPPEPIPKRPLRGQRQPRNQPPPPIAPRSSSRYQSLSDDAFLDKLKLGLDKKNDSTSATATSNVNNRKSEYEEENVDSGPPPDADELFKKMKETGLIPNAVAMLDGLCKDGLVQEAMKLFGLMREKGTIPDVVIYTAVVEGFCKAQRFDDAKRIFRKMLDNGITPNAFTYTVIIQGFYKCNHLNDTVDFCFQMLESGHSPNITTFVGLIDAFCRNKGVEEARSIVTKLQQNGFFLNEKAVREFLDKKGAVSSLVSEAVFGKKVNRSPFGGVLPPLS